MSRPGPGSGRRFDRRRARATLALAGALALPLAAGAADVTPQVDSSLPPLASGEQIYSHVCAACHMPNGEGASGAGRLPRLAGDKALGSWEYVALTVLNGRHGMPPFGGELNMGPLRLGLHLTDAQVAEVVNYVRTRFVPHTRSHVSAAQVRSLPHPQPADSPVAKETKR